MSKLSRTITQVAVELIEVNASLVELERAFTYLDGGYYYTRKLKLERRKNELEAILLKAEVGFTKDAPAEQYLVSEQEETLIKKSSPAIVLITRER